MTLRCVPLYLSFVADELTRTHRERDTTQQRIGSIDEVIAAVTDLVFGNIDWEEACMRLPAYDGMQAVDA